jgi:DNA-binding MarR family transcriptional regulator
MSKTDPFITTYHQWIDLFMHRSMRRFIHHARESGLSMSMVGTLFHLHRHQGVGVTDLGDYLGVTSAAASQMLERLAQGGLIQRTEDPEDRRVKHIELTEEGLRMLKDGLRAQQCWLKDLAEELSDEEKDQISSALNLMIERAKQME